METSTSFSEIISVIDNVRNSIDTIDRGGINPYHNSKYATLNNILGALNPLLIENGLSILQVPENCGITTLIRHKHSNEWVKFSTTAPLANNNAQGLGSLISYLRRYTLVTIFGLRMSDDDGNTASGINKQSQPKTNMPIQVQQKQQGTISTTQQPLAPNKKIFTQELLVDNKLFQYLNESITQYSAQGKEFSVEGWLRYNYEITEEHIQKILNKIYGK